MPGRLARRLAETVSLSLPKQETMPRPVITTRRMRIPLEIVSGSEHADPKGFGSVDLAAVDTDRTIGNGQVQLAAQDTLDMNVIGHLLGGRQHLAEELHFARTQCATTARQTLPAQEETDQLPHGVEAQAAWHHRVTFEVAGEEPQVRIDIQLGDQFTFAELATLGADMGDAIDHQHVRGGELRVTWAKQLTATAAQQVFPGIGVLLGHASYSIILCGRAKNHF